MQENNKKVKPISLKFILSVFAVLLVTVFYISIPSDVAKRREKKSFEEMLEYNTQLKKEQIYIPEYLREKTVEALPPEVKNMPVINENIIVEAQRNTAAVSPAEKIRLYNQLLDELAQYPSQSAYAIENASNRLLVFKGYPSNTVKIVISDSELTSSKSMDSYMLANFNFLTGEINVSQKMLYDLDIKTIIAILAHELDHFDKLAQVCKSIGVDEFEKIFTDNGVSGLNKSFWGIVSSFADIDKFEAGLYTNALKGFLTQKDLEQTSSYADFYRLAENMRNPLEISAYKESDYVYNHFNIPIIEGDMKRITNIFNEIDWAIYEMVDKMPIPKHERIALFDYFFANAIIDVLPQFANEYRICDTQKSGDMTSFWLAFENEFSAFYKQGKLTQKTKNELIALLNKTNSLIKNGLNPKEIAKAIQYKIYTLKSNLVYKGAVNNLRKTTINYLKYIKQENISSPQSELDAILLLICIDNNIYKSKEQYDNPSQNEISLFNIQIPSEVKQLYDLKNANRKFLFIYNLPAFKESNIQGNDNEKLVKMLDNNRLDIRTK